MIDVNLTRLFELGGVVEIKQFLQRETDLKNYQSDGGMNLIKI